MVLVDADEESLEGMSLHAQPLYTWQRCSSLFYPTVPISERLAVLACNNETCRGEREREREHFFLNVLFYVGFRKMVI